MGLGRRFHEEEPQTHASNASWRLVRGRTSPV